MELLMSHDAGVRYRINDQNEIVFVDETWDWFAEANDGAEIVASSVLGRNLWDFISDGATRQLYRQMVARVREGGQAQFKLRCDGPTCRRHLEMKIRATKTGHIEFVTQILKVEDRPPIPMLAKGTPRSTDLIRACSWCNRIHVDSGEWMEVEAAVEHLQIFEDGQIPQISHGMCEVCYVSISSTLDEIEAR